MYALDYSREFYAASIIIASVGLLLALLVWIRVDRKNRTDKANLKGRILGSIIAVGVIVIASLSLYATPKQQYEWDYSYSIEIKFLNMSSGLSFADFSVQATRQGNTANIYGDAAARTIRLGHLDHATVEDVDIRCNLIPVFWGSNVVHMSVFATFDRVVMFYRNGSTTYDVFDTDAGFWDSVSRDYYFEGGSNWVRLELRIEGPPVDP